MEEIKWEEIKRIAATFRRVVSFGDSVAAVEVGEKIAEMILEEKHESNN